MVYNGNVEIPDSGPILGGHGLFGTPRSGGSRFFHLGRTATGGRYRVFRNCAGVSWVLSEDNQPVAFPAAAVATLTKPKLPERMS